VRRLWVQFALRRLGVLVASVATLAIATFLVTQLVPGDPARAGLGPTAPPSQVEARRAALHLDEPVPTQFVEYVRGVASGDLGHSFASGEPVSEIIGDRFPATARLALLSFAVTILIGLPLGMTMGVLVRGARRRRIDAAFSGATGLMISVPEYLLATGLVALFGVWLDWLPIAGDDSWRSYVLPVIAYSALSTGMVARVARVEMLESLGQEYMLMARSKRLSTLQLYFRHAVPNALTATLTFSGLMLGACFAGTVLIEYVFAWPGLGSAIVQAIQDKDYPLVQGIVLLLGGIVLAVNLLVDVVLALLDPRILTRAS
jgi:peptide/nickel transport system permease protein